MAKFLTLSEYMNFKKNIAYCVLLNSTSTYLGVLQFWFFIPSDGLITKCFGYLHTQYFLQCCFIEKDWHTYIFFWTSWNYVSIFSFFLPIFQMIQTAYDDARIPKDAYNILLGLYIPVMILGTTLNLFLLCTIFSTKKLRTEPR